MTVIPLPGAFKLRRCAGWDWERGGGQHPRGGHWGGGEHLGKERSRRGDEANGKILLLPRILCACGGPT